MLEVLRHQQLDGVLASVVRYYGGIQLGAGGLVRAYTDCVAQALLHAEKITPIALSQIELRLDYAHEGLARRLIEQAGGELLEVRHASAVQISLRLPASAAESLREQLQTATRGELGWRED